MQKQNLRSTVANYSRSLSKSITGISSKNAFAAFDTVRIVDLLRSLVERFGGALKSFEHEHLSSQISLDAGTAKEPPSGLISIQGRRSTRRHGRARQTQDIIGNGVTR